MPPTGQLYTDLSGYYDQFCAHIDYAGQSDCARRLYALFCNAASRDYLDLACGSGQHIKHMLPYGFTATGVDNNAAMLGLAKARCPTVDFELNDMAALQHEDAFDLATCFLYSLHSSYPSTTLRQTLAGVYRALRPGGIFLCNAVDAMGIRNDAGIVSELNEGEALLRFQSAWRYVGTGSTLNLHLQISRESPSGKQHWEDHHLMTALNIPLLRHWLENTGFEVHLFEHDYETLRPWDALNHNVLVVAQKP